MPRPLFILTIAIFLLGCEEDLGLREDQERYFSLYGVLSPDLDIQSVRVYLVEDFLTLDAANPDDILFTSTDLITGEERVWQDSFQVSASGQRDLIYWSPFQAEYGHTYRIEATRLRDGARSVVEARVPPMVTWRIDDSDSTVVRVIVEGDQIRLLKPEIGYMVSAFHPTTGIRLDMRSYVQSYQGAEREMATSWEFTIITTRDRFQVQGMYNSEMAVLLGIECVLELHAMTLDAIVGDAAWDPPEGRFDPDVLSFPTTLSNVENGFGFVTGGYELKRALWPRREAVEYACFNYVW